MDSKNIYSFEDHMHAKICCEDLNYIGRGFGTRKFFSSLQRAAYGDSVSLEEVTQLLKLFVTLSVKDLETVINSYSDYIGIKSSSFKEKYDGVINNLYNYLNSLNDQSDNSSIRSNDMRNNINYIDPPIEKVVHILRSCVRECDRICEFNNVMLRAVSQTAPRFNKTNTESMVKLCFWFNDNDYNGIDTKDDNVKNSLNDEGTKEISKKMKSMKNYINSLVKKYFGKGTIFEEFDIENKVFS